MLVNDEKILEKQYTMSPAINEHDSVITLLHHAVN
jgi:hypothetical protein